MGKLFHWEHDAAMEQLIWGGGGQNLCSLRFFFKIYLDKSPADLI